MTDARDDDPHSGRTPHTTTSSAKRPLLRKGAVAKMIARGKANPNRDLHQDLRRAPRIVQEPLFRVPRPVPGPNLRSGPWTV